MILLEAGTRIRALYYLSIISIYLELSLFLSFLIEVIVEKLSPIREFLCEKNR